MQVKQFEYVREIARSGSITQVADKLYISRQALSESVRLLEQELGFAIFQRSNKGVIPTPEGEIFLKDLDTILPVIDSWKELSGKPKQKEKVKILVQYIISDYILYSQLFVKLNEFSDVEVEIEAVSGHDILSVVETDENSIGIMLPLNNGKVKPRMIEMTQQEKITVESLAKIEMCIVLANENPLCKKEQLMLSDLVGMELVRTTASAKSTSLQKVANATEKNGYILPVATDLLAFVAKQKNAIALLPKIIAENNVYVKNGLLQSKALLDYTASVETCYLVYHKKQEILNALLLETIREHFM